MQSDKKALTEGLLFGSDEGFSWQLRQLTRAAGVSHLVAASGANLRFVSTLWNMLFSPFSRRFVQYTSVLGVALYWMWAEQSGSLWRASGMWVITWVGFLWGKKIPLWYSFLLTVVFTFLGARSYLTPGFWLSSLAILGLFFSQKFLSGEKKSRLFPQQRFFSNKVALSLAEGTIIFACVSFWLIPQYQVFEPIGVYSTFLLSFLVDPLVWLGIGERVIMAVPSFLQPWVQWWLLDPLRGVQDIFFTVFFAALEWLASIGTAVSPFFLLLGAMLCCFPFVQKTITQRNRKIRWRVLYE